MKRVGMFVWNTFTNDARVLRECTTLSQNGYDVELFCIHDTTVEGLKREEIINPNFKVFRLRKIPKFIEIFNQGTEFLSKHVLALIGVIALFLLLLIAFPIYFIGLIVLILMLWFPLIQTLIFRSSLILKMTMKAYIGKYDIYHANDLNTLPQAYICAKWRIKRKKLIYDSHEVQTSRTGYNSKVHGYLERYLIRKIDRMMVENDTRAKYNEDLYGFYPSVLHNYPFYQESTEDKIDLHSLLNINKDEKILLYQGGIQVGRGLEKLIKAFPHFSEGTLVFIGDGKIKTKLEQVANEMNLTDKIKFIDKVPLEDLPKYTRNAYLGFQVLNNICFNHYSASSNKLFEYMMSEVPVIASDFPEIGKVVKENEIGLTVDSHDALDIARGVNILLGNEELRNQFSENCISARKRYNWEQEQKYLLKVYQSIS
jgi:glycosyltransferase involved in cell wall biosynthesis